VFSTVFCFVILFVIQFMCNCRYCYMLLIIDYLDGLVVG